MGNVYLAKDLQLTREVAIKMISSKYLGDEAVKKRIDRECRLHAIIAVHPHIVTLYDKITVGDQIFLIMEYVDGKTLADLIAEYKQNGDRFPAAIIAVIGYQVLLALQAIHSKGVLHRDIKPSNIIVSGLKQERVLAKLMDFGIAKESIDGQDATQLTLFDASGPGTPAYMAPERIDAETFGEVGPAADLYAVGIILYEMFQLEPPFQGTLTEIFTSHLTREIDLKKILFLPAGLDKVLAKALKKKIQERYNDAQIFADDLKRVTCEIAEQTMLSHSFQISPRQETMMQVERHMHGKRNQAEALSKKRLLIGISGSLLISILCLWYFLPVLTRSYTEHTTHEGQKTAETQVETVPEFSPAPKDDKQITTIDSSVQQTVSKGRDTGKSVEELPVHPQISVPSSSEKEVEGDKKEADLVKMGQKENEIQEKLSDSTSKKEISLLPPNLFNGMGKPEKEPAPTPYNFQKEREKALSLNRPESTSRAKEAGKELGKTEPVKKEKNNRPHASEPTVTVPAVGRKKPSDDIVVF